MCDSLSEKVTVVDHHISHRLRNMTEILQKSKVAAEIRNNRLILTFADTITKKDLDNLYIDVRFCVADLKTSFDIISDFSFSRVIQLSSIPTFRKIMNYLISRDAREVVRVVQDNRLVYKQILNLALRTAGYKPIYVATFKEAVSKLELVVKRDGMRIRLPGMVAQYQFGTILEQGMVLNISKSGCAITGVVTEPAIGEEVLLIFSFLEKGGLSEIKLQSRVVRSGGNEFAVMFDDQGKDLKERLWKCILSEMQNDK